MTTTSREPTPLALQILRNYHDETDDDHQEMMLNVDGGRYETVQRLITASPLGSNASENAGGEIETSLQHFVQRDGSILWRRVVVKSGPLSSATPNTIHASFRLPDEYYPNKTTTATTEGGANNNHNNNILCWASFPGDDCDKGEELLPSTASTNRKSSRPLLCVLAHPTLVCIWDVYPGNNSSGVGSSEGHYVPLPFEANGIFAVNAPGKKHGGLLIQRCETLEDLYTFEAAQQQLQQQAELDDDVDEDGFALKDPPRTTRTTNRASATTSTTARDGTGIPNLNLSTTTTSAERSAVNNSNSSSSMIAGSTTTTVPSVFSLSHPQGDILPISTPVSAQDPTMMGPLTDVFERILWVGTMEYVEDEKAKWLEMRQRSQPICVTYHTQLKRHGIWLLEETPAPPAQAPLWQVCSQWRSQNSLWDSHLGVLRQDLEDMELVDPTTSLNTAPSSTAKSVRKDLRVDALADALGVQQRRTTPRNATGGGIDVPANSRVSRGGHGGTGRSTHKATRSNNNNNSLVSPRTIGANLSFHTTQMDVSTSDNLQASGTMRVATFGSLFPNVAMTSIYMDSTPTVPAEKVFLVSNATGSGTRSVCLLCQSSLPGGIKKNSKEIRLFSLELVKENEEIAYKVVLSGSMPCIAAQPLQSSPVPKTFEPHRINRPDSWSGMATDLLLSYNDPVTGQGRLSLYRNTQTIVDCCIMEKGRSIKDVADLEFAIGDCVDVVCQHADNEPASFRGRLTLVQEGSQLGERVLQSVEAGLEKIDLLSIALKMRADVRRLENDLASSEDTGIQLRETICMEAVKTVVLSLFCLEMLSSDVNAQSISTKMGDDGPSHWERMLNSNYESIVQDCQDFLDVAKHGNAISSQKVVSPFDRLSKLQSTAIQMAKVREQCVTPSVFDALHFLYEDLKLHAATSASGHEWVGSILYTASKMAIRNPKISDEIVGEFLWHYRRDLPENKLDVSCNWLNHDGNISITKTGSQLSSFSSPPCILSWVEGALGGDTSAISFNFGKTEGNASCSRTKSMTRIFQLFCSAAETDGKEGPEVATSLKMAKFLIEEGFSSQSELCDKVPFGLTLPLLEALHRCRHEQADRDANANSTVWSLIGRNDLYGNMQIRKHGHASLAKTRDRTKLSGPVTSDEVVSTSEDSNRDGVKELEITSSMLFPEDNRIREVCRMLRSSRPIYLKVARAIEVSDHDYERKKQEKLLLLSRRVLALPIGRGMLTVGNSTPVQAEPLVVPEINLSGRVPPTNASLALDISETPVDMKVWPEFHNGVAAGLRLPLHSTTTETLSEITRTWIVYNRSSSAQPDQQTNANTNDPSPQIANHSHGGLLMALGMRGHLKALEMTDVFDYLTHGSITTTVGTLLGMSANMRGTCDISVSKMLCLHIPSLIPQHFSTIDVASTVQAAAISGTGLLYQGSCHRMMTEFLLNEIGKRPTTDGNVVDRESYTLSCGMALGMVLLCKGGSKADTGAGLADLRIEDRLYKYIVGGLDEPELRRRREETDRLSLPTGMSSGNNEKCSCIYEGESINTDVTSPGATLALGLMYMKSGNETIASAISLPDTHFLLEYVRPDFLMLRVIARALILWDVVQPTSEWVEEQIPKAVRDAYCEMRGLAENPLHNKQRSFSDEGEYDRQAVRLIYTHVVSGACFAIGLRYAGTGNLEAASAIFDRIFELQRLRDTSSSVSAALRPPTPVLEMCLGCAAISLAMVLAGTGHLDALRLLKILRWPCTDDLTYGGHQAYATAIGLLFLGGGTCTLGREPEDIAALLMAFFPRYPSSTSDNQYHLQALRNLYALATKKRELRAIDIDTGESVYVPVEVHYEDESVKPLPLSTPCLLLNSDEKPKELHVVSNRYYPLTIVFERGLEEQVFFVKRKSAYLCHGEDPLSQKSILTSTDTFEVSNSLDFLSSFTGDPRLHQLASHLCDFKDTKKRSLAVGPWSMSQFCSRALHECLLRDTQEALPLYIGLRNLISTIDSTASAPPSAAWDHRLVRSYCQKWGDKVASPRNGFLNSELMTHLVHLLEEALADDTSTSLKSIYFNLPTGEDSAEEKVDSDEMDLS